MVYLLQDYASRLKSFGIIEVYYMATLSITVLHIGIIPFPVDPLGNCFFRFIYINNLMNQVLHGVKRIDFSLPSPLPLKQ